MVPGRTTQVRPHMVPGRTHRSAPIWCLGRTHRSAPTSSVGADLRVGPHQVTRPLMNELADRFVGDLVSPDDDLAREFEARLTESSTLAFRVAYGVLRHRQ